MYRVNRRSISVLILIGIAILGMGYYIVRFVIYGSTWAGAPFNQTVYTGGVLNAGTVTDRNGVMLADVSDGKRIFSDSLEIRRSTLHAVGDKNGNIGTGALRVFSSQLTGYNLITGSYNISGNSGKTIALTIDSVYNTEAYRALDGRRGTVIVSNYKTGEILCMVSNPSFDPSNPPDNVDDESGIYLNRAIQSAYTPGSVFKLVTAAAAIENIPGVEDRTFICTGQFEANDDTVVCNGVHNTIDLVQGLRQSCNVVFGELALELGADILFEYTSRYDLSESIKIDNISAMSGHFDMAAPGTADLAWSGVGQYNNLINPASMLRFAGAIANEGSAVNLHFLKETGLSKLLPNSTNRLMPRATAQKLNEMMNIYPNGNFPGLEIHAKSGTAQVGSDVEPHAWYVGYITNPDHPYAFVVVVENGGGGSATAAPIANRVLQKMVS